MFRYGFTKLLLEKDVYLLTCKNNCTNDVLQSIFVKNFSCYCNREKSIKHSSFSQDLLSTNYFQCVRFKWSYEIAKANKYKSKIREDKAEKLFKEVEDPDFEKIPPTTMPGSKIIIVPSSSLRVDFLLKAAFGISRSNLDVAFYKGFIRLNGKKYIKKGISMEIGDEADYIKGFDPENHDLLQVSRIELLDFKKTSGDTLRVKIQKFNNLSIENYKEQPWKEETNDDPSSVRETEELK